MCGIFAILGKKNDQNEKTILIEKLKQYLHHRGPDSHGDYSDQIHLVFHTRLAIIDPNSGKQPFIHDDHILTINGEIYNYKDLIKSQFDSLHPYTCSTQSDCEVILHLFKYADLETRYSYQWHNFDHQCINKVDSSGNTYLNKNEQEIERILNLLSGDFSFVYIDKKRKQHIAARDPIGVTPLYYAYNTPDISSIKLTDDSEFTLEIAFSSEMKTLSQYDVVKVFPPGTYYDGQLDSKNEPFLKYYYKASWKTPLMNNSSSFDTMTGEELITSIDEAEFTDITTNLRNILTTSVIKRLMSDVPFGVLLSGGLDSSLVASIASKACKELYGNDYKLKTFSISLENSNSSDKKAAQTVADFLGTEHHHFEFTIRDGLHALPSLIEKLESYDITTIRASMPMYLLSKQISQMNIKMVLSGEGSDEIFGGYLYFHEAPNITELRNETIRRVNNLHLSDCLRANKSTMAWSLEARVPFLDKDFIAYAMTIPPQYLKTYKQSTTEPLPINVNMEKWILRSAFNTTDLPHNILWRQKEQFSDGVGYGWIDNLKHFADTFIINSQLQISPSLFPINTPTTKEGYLYREIFERMFPTQTMINTVMTWIPAWSTNKDPSGRAQTVHIQSLSK